MNAPKRIILVDDHPLFREGLAALLESRQDIRIAGQAGTCAAGLAQFRDIRPDLTIIDISLPDGSGIDLTRQIRTVQSGAAVLILSMHTGVDFIAAAFQAGASGYMSKESGGDGILHAMETILNGGQYLDGSLSPSVLRRLSSHSERRIKSMDTSYGTLSPREQQVMRLLAEGLTPDEIAEKLFVSRKTVLNHRYAIMNKLGIKTPMAFVRHAARLGLIDFED